MSEITIKTIETLPLVDQPTEEASLVGWNNGQTVRMPVSAVGGEGLKGIVFTWEYDGSSVAPTTLGASTTTGSYILSCNYEFEEFYELLLAGSPVVFIDTDYQTVTSCYQGYYYTQSSAVPSSIEPLASGDPSYPYAELQFYTPNGPFYIQFGSDYFDGWYGGGGES